MSSGGLFGRLLTQKGTSHKKFLRVQFHVVTLKRYRDSESIYIGFVAMGKNVPSTASKDKAQKAITAFVDSLEPLDLFQLVDACNCAGKSIWSKLTNGKQITTQASGIDICLSNLLQTWPQTARILRSQDMATALESLRQTAGFNDPRTVDQACWSLRQLEQTAKAKIFHGVEKVAKATAYLQAHLLGDSWRNASYGEVLAYLLSRGVACEQYRTDFLVHCKTSLLKWAKSHSKKVPQTWERLEFAEIVKHKAFRLPFFWAINGYKSSDAHFDIALMRACQWIGIEARPELWEEITEQILDGHFPLDTSDLYSCWVNASPVLFELCLSDLAIRDDKGKVYEALAKLQTVGDDDKIVRDVHGEKFKESGTTKSPARENIPLASTTVFAGYRLQRVSGMFHPNFANAVQFLLQQQTDSGAWKWWADDLVGDVWSTAAAVHALSLAKPRGWQDAAQKGAEWLLDQQDRYGCWRLFHSERTVFLTVFVLDAIELAKGGTQVTFQLPAETLSTYTSVKTDLAARPPGDKTLAERFTFPHGQAKFDGQDLRVPTGVALQIIEKLVSNFGQVVQFRQLDNTSDDHEASEKIRSAIRHLRHRIKEKKIPAKLENRKGIGYVLLPSKR